MFPCDFLKYGFDIGAPDGHQPGKLMLPEELPYVGSRPVYYSDIDYNGHLNNAVYGDILCDFLPGGMFGKRILEAQVNYLSETRFGETLKLYAGEQDGETYLFGEHERGRSFECRVAVENV